jgi:hypothetical protein
MSFIVTLFITGHPYIGTFFSILTIPIITFRIRKKYILTIMISYFILEPALMFTIIGMLLAGLTHSSSDLFFIVYVLASVPVFSFVFLILDIRNINFLNKAKIALEYNNVIFIILAGLSVIYAYASSDFDFLKPMVNFQKISEEGFQARDAFSFIVAIFSFPFLVSTALNKALVEHALHRQSDIKL